MAVGKLIYTGLSWAILLLPPGLIYTSEGCQGTSRPQTGLNSSKLSLLHLSIILLLVTGASSIMQAFFTPLVMSCLLTFHWQKHWSEPKRVGKYTLPLQWNKLQSHITMHMDTWRREELGPLMCPTKALCMGTERKNSFSTLCSQYF